MILCSNIFDNISPGQTVAMFVKIVYDSSIRPPKIGELKLLFNFSHMLRNVGIYSYIPYKQCIVCWNSTEVSENENNNSCFNWTGPT